MRTNRKGIHFSIELSVVTPRDLTTKVIEYNYYVTYVPVLQVSSKVGRVALALNIASIQFVNAYILHILKSRN